MSSLARDEPPVELGRDADDLLVLGVDPEEDRRHVGVRDAAEADHGPGPSLTAWVAVRVPTSRPYAVEATGANVTCL